MLCIGDSGGFQDEHELVDVEEEHMEGINEDVWRDGGHRVVLLHLRACNHINCM